MLKKLPPQTITLFLVFVTALLWTLSKNASEFSKIEIALFSGFCLFSFVAQAGVVALLARWPMLSKIVASVMAAFAVYSLIIIHNARFTSLGMAGTGALLAIMTVIFAVVFLQEKQLVQRGVRTFALVMMGMIVLQAAFAGVSTIPLQGLPEFYKLPAFKTKPNVYVISFDAISPAAVIKKNLGITNLPYLDVIDKYNGKIVRNAFAPRIPTKKSINAFMAMDLAYFDSKNMKNVFILDEDPNPVYEIFRSNGYKIQFLYESYYFGPDTGRLDYYKVAQISGMCEHVEKKMALLGYCLDGVQSVFDKFLDFKGAPYPQFLFDRIATTGKSGEPWFTYAHIYTPGHAQNSIDMRKPDDVAEYKERFPERVAEAARVMEDLLKTIKQNDPEGILIIQGDHGALISANVMGDINNLLPNMLEFDRSKMPEGLPMSFEQIVQDRHGVLLAVFPKTFCQQGFKQNPYSTVRVMRDVIKCLSGGEDPLPSGTQPDDSQWKPYKYE